MKKFGIKEFLAIVILSMGTKIADGTSKILLGKLDNAAWMSPIIQGLLMVIPLILLIKTLSVYKEKNLIDVINHLFGRYLGLFSFIILFLLNTVILATDIAAFTDIINTLYFPQTPNLVISLLLMSIAIFAVKIGIQSIASFAWVTLILVKLSVIFIIVTSLIQGQLAFLFPILGPGGLEVIKESTKYTSIFSDFILFGLLLSHIRNFAVFKKGIWIGLVIACIEFTLGYVSYVVLFDFNGASLISYPFHESIRYIQIGFMTNLESIFLPFWLLSIFFRLSLYLYFCVFLFGTIFRIREFAYIAPAFALLIALFGMFLENPTKSIFILKSYILAFTSPVLFLLPILLWLAAKFKGEFKHGQDKTSKTHIC